MESFIYQAIVTIAFLLIPSWKIFQRAGLNPMLSLTLFIPTIGIFVTGLILTFSEWKWSSENGGEQ